MSQIDRPLANTWGGRRRGAGRKAKHKRAGVPHLRRAVSRHQPLHVTMRVRDGLPSLRSQSIFRCVLDQIHAAKKRFLRIAHCSVQSNHIHLVEAEDRKCLGQGMKGFAVRVARRVNRLLSSRGNILADRYHARTLRTPRDVRNVTIGQWSHVKPGCCVAVGNVGARSSTTRDPRDLVSARLRNRGMMRLVDAEEGAGGRGGTAKHDAGREAPRKGRKPRRNGLLEKVCS